MYIHTLEMIRVFCCVHNEYTNLLRLSNKNHYADEDLRVKTFNLFLNTIVAECSILIHTYVCTCKQIQIIRITLLTHNRRYILLAYTTLEVS